MKAFHSNHADLALPDGHRFPAQKYRLLHDRLANELPEVRLLPARRASDGELALAHLPDYIAAACGGSLSAAAMREIGFPWSPALLERARHSVGATMQAVRWATREGIGANLAGGTHHAFADRGSGFCIFNDVAVAARLAQADWRRRRAELLKVAVIDLDVHQGNGTASIFAGDPSVFTLSIHGEKNFPFRKEPGDLDVPLPDGSGDDSYLAALDRALAELHDRFEPGLVIYLAGADPFEGDRLGRLRLSYAGLRERDRRVFEWCWGRGVPVAFVMAGGYGHRIDETVQVQFNTFGLALAYWKRWSGVQGRVLGACTISDGAASGTQVDPRQPVPLERL